MKVILGSDKSGFTLKEALKPVLQQWGHEIIEIGTTDPNVGVPFFKVAPEAAKYLQEGNADRAILICGTGMGMSQVANKYKGIRAACVESLYGAKMCRAINDSNVLCMGGFIVGSDMGINMVKTFLNTEFVEGMEHVEDFLKQAYQDIQGMEEKLF